MATTRDRYILDVDTRSATRAIENLKRSIDSVGGAQTQQRMRQLQQSINNIKVAPLAREIEQLKRRLEQLGRTNVDNTFNKLDNSASKAAGSLGMLKGAFGAVAAVVSVGALVDWTRSAIDAKVQMDALRNSLTTFVGSADRAQQEMQRITGLANEMGIRVEDLANSFTIFSRFGLDTSTESLRAWANIAFASGKSLDQLGEAVADALTGEFERLKEFGIKVSQENGVFTASIAGQQDIIANTTTELIQKLQELGAVGGAWAGGIDRNANSLSGSIARLSNATTTAQIAFVQGLEPALIAANNAVANFINSNEKLIQDLGENLGRALQTLAENIDLVVAALQGMNTSLLELAGIDITDMIGSGVDSIIRKYEELTGATDALVNMDPSRIADMAREGILSYDQAIEELKTKLQNAPGLMLPGIGFVFEEDQAYVDNLRELITQLESAKLATEILGDAQETGAAATERAQQANNKFMSSLRNTPTVDFYQTLIRDSSAAVNQTAIFQSAIEGLNEALSKGVISPEIYAEAMRRVNEQMAEAAPRTYLTVLEEVRASFAETASTTAMNADAMAMLTEQYSNGTILLEQYRAGVDALGGSFDEYLLSIGDTGAYLANLQSTIEQSIRADENKSAAIRQLTADFESGQIAPELYRQMMAALGVEIDAVTGRTRALQDQLNALTATADQSLQAMEERIRAAQEQAELSGYEGIKRTLRSIILEEERLRDATIERLRAQALAGEISETELNAQIARIEEQTRATIAARQRAAEIEDANRETAERAREAMRPVTPNIRTPAVPQTPGSMWDRIFGGANAGGISTGGPNGSRSNPLYVIPVFGSIKDLVDNISKSVINASDLTGNVTGVLNSLSAPIASANRGGGFLGSLFGGFFATGGNIPAGRYGIVGESGPEVVEGPATVTPITGQQVVYNINAVDVRSFQDMLARDPGFVHAVVQRAQRRVPGAR